ncbi:MULTISPECIES: hypothetical protein [Burkholderia cepacia complex]|uniref:hypothetical protein n=1 Tax=Burkholderia cepacia complex TaxID=87882 RepID=UPI00064BDD9B|nr:MULTISPECIES: hypothetical protein [Burkholderia cepacia complex]AKM02660.1 hypothetical protein ABD05_20850 [Burkholderia pyrrocinia]
MSIIVHPGATRVGTLENHLRGSGLMPAGLHRGLPQIGAPRASTSLRDSIPPALRITHSGSYAVAQPGYVTVQICIAIRRTF